jgi:uncharacterized protein
MDSLRVVLDTNALLRCISRKSAYAIVLDKIYQQAFELYVTSDILLEYEEKIAAYFSPSTSEKIIAGLSFLSNVKRTEVYFFLNIITEDADDNKFVDCAFAANAHYMVTDDRHFNVLKNVSFPSINVITLDAFKSLLLSTL